jgi:rhodanese-related sulfurtransferase
MRGVTVQMAVLVVGVAVAVLLAAGIAVAGTPTITHEELKAKLGDPDLIIVDVRRAGHWEASDRKIAGAVREDPKDVEGWAGKYAKDKTLVLYCA